MRSRQRPRNKTSKGVVRQSDKLAELKARVAKLEQIIADKDAKDHFLRLPNDWLHDAERKVMPGIEKILPLIEQLLTEVEVTVAKYGPSVHIIG
jgi:hypothetical protein